MTLAEHLSAKGIDSSKAIVEYKGEICKFHKIKDSEEKGIVIIHQELALIPEMSIAENMFLGDELGLKIKVDWNKEYVLARKYLDMVGLSENVHTLIKDIGTGKQQLVEIAKALAKKSRLLILDEPTNHLDIFTIEKLEDIEGYTFMQNCRLV